MIKLTRAFILIAAFAIPAAAQKIIRATPTPTPAAVVKRSAPPAVPLKSAPDKGVVIGNVYTNRAFGFELTFPAEWRIAGEEHGEYLKSLGYDLSLKAPPRLPGANQVELNRALQNVTVLLTAFWEAKGSTDSAILRISVEDLTAVPQVKDAVDYFDLMRNQFASMKLEADFNYSETQAEKLGRKQFAFLDARSSAGKKRMYATVKGRHAIMITLTYGTDEHLNTMRQILAAGDFSIK